jgi:hypothetical protein
MANETGAQLNEIGNILARDTDFPLDGTLLYVEADWGTANISIFKNLGAHLLWRDPTQELSYALLELWESEALDKRWSSMLFRIEGEKFAASFTYDPLDLNVSTIDRREVILQERYGNKQVIYPPLM